MILAAALLALQSTNPPPAVRIEPRRPETALFSRVGGWRVMVDHTLGSGCFLLTTYEGGTVFRIGINRLDGNGYIIFGNDAWRSLRDGEVYTIQVQFDSEPEWQGNASAFRMGSGQSVMLSLTIDDPDFLREFTSRTGMRVTWQGREIANLELTDSAAATRELARCQDANPRDPFAVPQAPRSADPFEL